MNRAHPRSKPHHAPPPQTLAQTRTRLVTELATCTDAAFAAKSVDGLHRGSYSRLGRDVIAAVFAEEQAKRGLSPQERFARVMEGSR